MNRPKCVCGHAHEPDICSIIGCDCRSFRDQRDKEIEQLKLQKGEAEALCYRLREILRSVEWSQDGPMKSYCPVCEAEKGRGHDEGCDLGHALHGKFPPSTLKDELDTANRLNHDLQNQVAALRAALISRRAAEPRHSREDHECAECVMLSEIDHSIPRCEHGYINTKLCSECTPSERPKGEPVYVCNKCGYGGPWQRHPLCEYLAVEVKDVEKRNDEPRKHWDAFDCAAVGPCWCGESHKT